MKQMMNKNGFIQFTPLVILALLVVVVALIVVPFFLFSTVIRNVLIGVALMIGAIWIVTKTDSTKVKIVAIITLAILGVLFVFGSSIIQTSYGSGEFIQVNSIGYYQCEAATSPVVSEAKTLTINKPTTISCNFDTNACQILVTVSGFPVFSAGSLNVAIVRANGQTEQQQQVVLYKTSTSPQTKTYSINRGDKLIVEPRNIDSANYKSSYIPYILVKYPGLGGRFPATDIGKGCSFSSLENNNLILTSTFSIPHTQTSDKFNALEPEKSRNYIDVPVSSPIESFRVQNNNYCMNNKLYPIKQIQTLANTYKIVDYQSSSTSVQCCYGEDVGPNQICNKNNQIEKLNVNPDTGETNLQCSAFKPCPGFDEAPLDKDTLQQYQCVNNMCIQKTRDVECTTDSACSGTAKPICDTRTWSCVAATLPIGDGNNVPRNTTQTECTDKAEKYPYLGYEWITTTTEPSVLNKVTLGLLGTGPTETSYCKATFVIYYVLIAIVLIIAIILAVIFIRPNKGRRKR